MATIGSGKSWRALSEPVPLPDDDGGWMDEFEVVFQALHFPNPSFKPMASRFGFFHSDDFVRLDMEWVPKVVRDDVQLFLGARPIDKFDDCDTVERMWVTAKKFEVVITMWKRVRRFFYFVQNDRSKVQEFCTNCYEFHGTLRKILAKARTASEFIEQTGIYKKNN